MLSRKATFIGMRNLMRNFSTFSLAYFILFYRSPMYETFRTKSKIK